MHGKAAPSADAWNVEKRQTNHGAGDRYSQYRFQEAARQESNAEGGACYVV